STMSGMTTCVRSTRFDVGHRGRYTPQLSLALTYVPVAVLTAIVAQIMLMPDGDGLQLTLDNAYLVGGVAAILIAARWRNLLATIAGGMLCFFLWRWFYG